MRYYLCQRVLESNIAFPELLPAVGRQPQLTFVLDSVNGGAQPAEWFHHWRLPDETLWASLGRSEEGYLIRFPDLADFQISADGTEVCCQSVIDTPLETTRHLFLDQVMPVVLSLQGNWVLHASAIALPTGAIAFLGATGLGKSTLTASFTTRGFSLLTDDCLLLEEQNSKLFSIPSYPGVRLWSDSIAALFAKTPSLAEVAHYTCKKRVTGQDDQLGFCIDAVPLGKIYLLAQPDELTDAQKVTITALSPREAYIELFKHTFQLDITDRTRLKQSFERLGRIIDLSSVYRLSYPREHVYLPVVQQALLAHQAA